MFDTCLYCVQSFAQTRDVGLGITFMLMLLGRSLITPLWDVPTPSKSMSASAVKPNSALISWARLTRAMIIRPFRFILPVIAIVALQWGLASSGRTSNSNAVGMDEPYWGMVRNFAGFCTLVWNSVSDRMLRPRVRSRLIATRLASSPFTSKTRLPVKPSLATCGPTHGSSNLHSPYMSST